MLETIQESLVPITNIFYANWGNLLATLVILVLGWIIAKVLKIMVVRGFKLVKLDVVAEKAGIEAFLRKGGMQSSSIEILGVLIYWIALILFLMMILAIWNIDIGLSGTLVPFLPKIFAALVILLLGLFIASIIEDIVRTTAANAEIRYAFALAKTVKWILVIFIVLTAVQQLELETKLISWGFLIILGSLGLGLGLAIGLGAKDVVAKRIEAWVVKLETEAKQASAAKKTDK
jgi:hypothetical protein